MVTVSPEIIGTLSRDIYAYITTTLKKARPSVYERSLLGEAYLCLESLQYLSELPAHEQVILSRACKKIHRKLWCGDSIFYFSSFYYLKSGVKHKSEPEIQRDFQKINLDIMAMLLNIKEVANSGRDLGFSEDDCFFDRVPMCNSAFLHILRARLNALYAPTLYCLCNLLQTLFLYYSTISGKYQDQAASCIALLMKTLRQYGDVPANQKLMEDNPQLSYFIMEQQNYYLNIDPTFQLINLYPTLSVCQKPRTVLRSLTNLTDVSSRSLFEETFETVYELYSCETEELGILEKILFLRNIVSYLTITGQSEISVPLNISEHMPHFDLDGFLNQTFRFDQVDLSAVTPELLDKVMCMKDDELRCKFANTIQGVRTDELQRESSKPHGSFEIADMELRMIYRGSAVFLCMPFKSGVEIREQTVPINVAYQIVRPFTEFEHCVVVFVTAKPCSESLMNQIKKLRDRFNWPIAVIEEQYLTALLILHKQL